MAVLNGSGIPIHTIRVNPLLFPAAGGDTCKANIYIHALLAAIGQLEPPFRVRGTGVFPGIARSYFRMIWENLPSLPRGLAAPGPQHTKSVTDRILVFVLINNGVADPAPRS